MTGLRAIVAGVALAASLGTLGWLLFTGNAGMPMTVLISGLIAIASAVRLSEQAIDRSPHEVKKTLGTDAPLRRIG